MLGCNHGTCSNNSELKCVAFTDPSNFDNFFRIVFSAGGKKVFELNKYVRNGVCTLEKTGTILRLTFS